jgi:hypothetical protein
VRNKRLMQWLIPLLFGFGAGITIAWTVEIWVPGRGVVGTYVAPFGIMALLATALLKSRVGYHWPWEGSAEWDEAGEGSTKINLRGFFVFWVFAVLLLLALFTLFQPRS